jgi:hypothetical protein
VASVHQNIATSSLQTSYSVNSYFVVAMWLQMGYRLIDGKTPEKAAPEERQGRRGSDAGHE